MVGHILDLAAHERRELLGLLTQERADVQTDDEVLADLSETLRRQLGLSEKTDLADGFRRRMIRIAEELEGQKRSPGHDDFRSDRAIAQEVLSHVQARAQVLSAGREPAFSEDFAKSFKTMSRDRRAAWLREAALAASANDPHEAAARRAAEAAKQKVNPDDTAARIANDVAEMAARALVDKGASSIPVAGPAVLGLVAGGAVAFAIRNRRKARGAAAEDRRERQTTQVRRERQATQAVVTTCAYVLAALEPG